MVFESISVGSTIDERYLIDLELGEGATARVFRATDLELKRVVAVKLLRQDRLPEEDRLPVERECKVLALLNHPHFGKVYQIGRFGEAPYVVMEFIHGTSLRSWLACNGKMEPCTALKMTFALCDALSYAHERGIVHRDLNPNNIMLVDGNPLQPKIIDFGLARLTTQPSTRETAGVMGTPHYMSPEQFQTAAVDARSDIYALGCTLYECLTGERTFDADVAMGLAWKHSNETAPLPSRISALPEGTDGLVSRALMKNPDHRYQSALLMAEDIQLIMTGQGDSISRPASARCKQNASFRFSKRQLFRVVCSAGVLLVLCSLFDDPGGWLFIARAMEIASPRARCKLLRCLADTCHSFNKPRAEIETCKRLLSATVASSPQDARPGLVVLQRLALLLLACRGPAAPANAELLTSVTVEYVKMVAGVLSDAKSSGSTAKPKIDDKVLSTHLQVIQNATFLCGPDTQPIESSLSAAITAIQDLPDWPETRVRLGDLNLYLSRKYSSSLRRMDAFYFCGLAHKIAGDHWLAQAYMTECLDLLNRYKPAGYLGRRLEWNETLWKTDYAAGVLLQAVVAGRQLLDELKRAGDAEKTMTISCEYANALAFIGMYNESISVLEPLASNSKAIAQAPVLRDYLSTLSKSYTALGCAASAQRYYKAAVPSIRIAWIPAVLEIQNGNATEGMMQLLKWRDEIKKQCEPFISGMSIEELCKVLLACGRFQECQQLCEIEIAQAQPKDNISERRLRLAFCKEHFGYPAEAERLCSEAIDDGLFEASQYDGYVLMARLCTKRGDKVKARKYARLALPLSILKRGPHSKESAYLAAIAAS